MFTLTGSSFVLLIVTIEPPLLKVLSDEHEVAWMQKYFFTTWNQIYEDLLDVNNFLVINPKLPPSTLELLPTNLPYNLVNLPTPNSQKFIEIFQI